MSINEVDVHGREMIPHSDTLSQLVCLRVLTLNDLEYQTGRPRIPISTTCVQCGSRFEPKAYIILPMIN